MHPTPELWTQPQGRGTARNEHVTEQSNLYTNSAPGARARALLQVNLSYVEFSFALGHTMNVVQRFANMHQPEEDLANRLQLLRARFRSLLGRLLNQRLLLYVDNGLDVKTRSGKTRSSNTPAIKALIQFVLDFTDDTVEDLIEELIENNCFMKDWECMTDLLLEEPGEGEVALTIAEETALVELLSCCLDQATSYEAPLPGGSAQGITLDYRALQQQEDKKHVTEHFLKVLPSLLDRYRTDLPNLHYVLPVPGYFDLDICGRPEQQENLDLLLGKMCDILRSEHNTHTLDVCARSLQYLCSPGLDIFTKCDAARSNLIGGVVDKYKEDIASYRCAIDKNEQPKQDQIDAVVESLKKVAYSFYYEHTNTFVIWDSLLRDVKNPRYTLPEKARGYCIDTFGSILCMQNRALSKNVVRDDDRYEEELQKLKDRLGEFMGCMSYFIDSNNTAGEIPASLVGDACTAVCDVIASFSDRCVVHKKNSWHLLVYEPDQDMKDMLFKIVREQALDGIMPGDFSGIPRRREILGAFCELVAYDLVPTAFAAYVFKHFVKHEDQFGDMIGSAIRRLLNVNKINCASAMQESLNILYSEAVAKCDGIDWNNWNNDFNGMRELARRFAHFFEYDLAKNAEAVVAVHQQGLLFAISSENGADPTGLLPMNFTYLAILTEFSYCLLVQDKKVVLDFLDERVRAAFSFSGGEYLQPLLYYRNSLANFDMNGVYGFMEY